MARSPRIRMPRVVLPTRRRGAGSRGGGSEAPTKTATQATEPKAATKADTGAAVAVAGAKAPDLNERIAGLQGWMAEIERRQGRITYFGAAAVLIAIAAAGAALYFGITAKNDSATKGDVDALSKKVDGLQGAVTKNSRDTQATLNDTVNRLQASIAAAQKQQAQQAATISTLQSQVAAGALGKGAAGATPGTAPTTSTPGATGGKTKTTP
ncbi:MAG: hypothetical protein ACJ75Z_08310 [Solirubrobacterales bacterium]